MGIKSFFDRLASFDTETTGVDTKEAKMWQTGFTGKGIDAEHVVNPFFVLDQDDNLQPEKMSPGQFRHRLKNMNGVFSEEAMAEKQFELLMDRQAQGTLSESVDESLRETLGRMKTNSVLVMQNHNFENKLLLQNHKDGLISDTVMDELKGKMQHLGYNREGDLTNLFQVPTEVERYQRYAQRSFRDYKSSDINKRANFDKYTQHLNTMMDRYGEATKDKTKVAIIEQMDVTKALYANAIKHGFMDPRHATVGLSMNFLTNTLLDRAEKHTALSDSKDTVEVFKRTWNMVRELRTGTTTEQTQELLAKMNDAQYTEVQRQFKSSVHSVLNDFSINGYTRYTGSSSLFQPAKLVNDVEFKQLNSTQGKVYDFDAAMDNVMNSYREHDGSAARLEYINEVKQSVMDKGYSNTHGAFTRAEAKADYSQFQPSKAGSTLPTWFSEPTHFLGRDMTKGTKYGLIGGAVLGLGTMLMTDSPEKQDTNSYVAEEFYDPMYLGTDFVNFNNRNKHYMY